MVAVSLKKKKKKIHKKKKSEKKEDKREREEWSEKNKIIKLTDTLYTHELYRADYMPTCDGFSRCLHHELVVSTHAQLLVFKKVTSSSPCCPTLLFEFSLPLEQLVSAKKLDASYNKHSLPCELQMSWFTEVSRIKLLFLQHVDTSLRFIYADWGIAPQPSVPNTDALYWAIFANLPRCAYPVVYYLVR